MKWEQHVEEHDDGHSTMHHVHDGADPGTMFAIGVLITILILCLIGAIASSQSNNQGHPSPASSATR